MSEQEFDAYIEQIQEVRIRQNEPPQQQIKNTGAIRKSVTPSSNLPKNFNSTVEKIKTGIRICVLLRGLPGSGKSYLARRLIEETLKDHQDPKNHIISTDNYFYNKRGEYRFDPQRLPEAHDAAQKLFTQCACKGYSPLIVDNTNIKYWEMYYYLQVATQYKYDIVIMEPETPWKWKDDKLAIKNIHSVPSDKIKRMKQNYESGVSLVELLGSLNLELPREPLMRNFPPIEPPTPPMEESPIIDFRPDENLLQSLLGKEQSSETFQWKPPPQIFNDNWETMGDEIPQEKQLKKESTNPQPQRKQRKNKQKQSLSLSPHCQFCPNENPAFTQFREVYPQVNDIYLWDFFEKCKGDAEYAIGLLCEENLSDDIMNSRNELTCKCFSSAIPKNSEDVKQSPVVVKPKKSRSENNIAKNNSLDEWFETKKVIEESITMHDDHYPEHVRLVKSWKRGTKIETEVEPETVSNTVIHCEEEMMSVPIGNDLILELDKEFGGALLEYDMETNPFPPKILLKRSTAHQLYFDIIEAYYSQIEEAKLLSIKKDEELAKTLAEQEKIEKYPEIYQAAEPKDLKDIIELQEAKKRFEKEFLQSEYKPDDWALTLSKEKLIGIFPDIPKTDLMNIFAGFDYNFNETVQALQDSCQLDTNQSERKKLIEAQNNIFNLPTTNEPPPGLQSSDDAEDSEDLKTIELLRETIDFHRNSQKCAQEKIRDAVSSKQYDVATYYSNISRLHKKKAEESSHDVANLVALLHEKSHGEDAVLDLHFFNHIEAGTILDTFLDKNISKLRAMKKPYVELFIITGRGKNSVNGIATIKNKSKIRLGQRNLKSSEVNPGLLKVKVHSTSLLSNEIFQRSAKNEL